MKNQLLDIETDQKDTGKFKICIDQEGYQSNGFTRGTVLDSYYLIGKGPLSTQELVDDILWPIIKRISNDYDDPSRVITQEFADPIQDKPNRKKPAATTATKSTYDAYSEDANADITIHFYRYDDVTMYRNGCGYGEGAGWTRPSKESVHEAAEYIDNELERKQEGARRVDYRREKPLYRPPVEGINFVKLDAENKQQFIERKNSEFRLNLLDIINIIQQKKNWESEILINKDNDKEIKPAISCKYTGDVIKRCGIPSKQPGFTVVAIPQLEEFIIETKTISFSDSEIEEFDLPIDWNCGTGTIYGDAKEDPRGIKFYNNWFNKMFINSKPDLIKVVNFIINHFEERINSKSWSQITDIAHGIGDKNREKLKSQFNIEELLNATKEELKSVEGVGEAKAKNLHEITQNRRVN